MISGEIGKILDLLIMIVLFVLTIKLIIVLAITVEQLYRDVNITLLTNSSLEKTDESGYDVWGIFLNT